MPSRLRSGLPLVLAAAALAASARAEEDELSAGDSEPGEILASVTVDGADEPSEDHAEAPGSWAWRRGLQLRQLWDELRADPKQFAQRHRDAIRDMGWRGVTAIFLSYLLATVFLLPMWGFHGLVGYVYGPWKSVIFITTTQAVCAGAAFLASRHVLRPRVRAFMARRYGDNFDRICAALERDGLRIITLLRLTPVVPFGLNNYLSGVSDMRLGHFVLGTWLGVFPGNVVYCQVGTIVDGAAGGWVQNGLLFLGFFCGLGCLKLVSDAAAQALGDAGVGGSRPASVVRRRD
eukprot:TRINITY_DN60292_c0_g1_i1.p2 TRINITY_DN60292_c0_g1~~TRINITY_DN60292_c0_g1_i1.p2  ORF type:complete len:319 (+),score=69.74 TRINITY_DN60292_c0_g1_i1:85-957(+)